MTRVLRPCNLGAGYCNLYSGYCSLGYWLPVFGQRDVYPVTPDTVLPDEPGHIA